MVVKDYPPYLDYPRVNTIPSIDLEEEDFGAVLNCAIRYCLGRQSYMPSLVIDYVRPLLPYLSHRTIKVMWNDVRSADQFSGYGDETIDKPLWMSFLEELVEELDRRDKEND